MKQRRQTKRRRRETAKGRMVLLVMLIITAVVYIAVGREIFEKKKTTEETNVTEIAVTEKNTEETAEHQEKKDAGNVEGLKEQITQIKKMELGKYTEETVQKLIETITAAQILIEENAEQEKLDQMSQKLAQAVEALVISQ